MGSDLYVVSTTSCVGCRVTLDVQIIHPDAMSIPPDPGFALMLLREGADDDAPLAHEVSFDDCLDESWMGQYALGFIRSVEVTTSARKRRLLHAQVNPRPGCQRHV